MCGIIGSFPLSEPSWVEAGLIKIRHRGPDARRWENTPYGCLGHARLAILDVAQGHQPMREGDRWIVFNGEIYNYQELQKQLAGPFHTNSDTEVILKLYAEKGSACVTELDGMFAFAILDDQGLFLARDPIGIKPLYYAEVAETLYFASEIKALLPFSREIHEFPPGTTWHSKTGFQPFFSFQDFQSQTENKEQGEFQPSDLGVLRKKLFDAVNKRLIADVGVPVGISLSGGLDSSIIAALARTAKERVDTFAVGMAGSQDLEASEQMARFLDTHHHTYTYTFEDMLAVLPEVIYYLESFDAPLIRSAIPNFFLARLASDYVKVILTGEGADELFAGYEYLRDFPDPRSVHQEQWEITNNLHHTNLQRTDRMTMAHGIEGRVPFLDKSMIEMAFRMPTQWMAPKPGFPEKYMLRRAFEDRLPDEITWRPKQKFSQGTGSANLLAVYANEQISNAEWNAERAEAGDFDLRSKEELLYYRIFRNLYGEQIPLRVVGRTRSVTRAELM